MCVSIDYIWLKIDKNLVEIYKKLLSLDLSLIIRLFLELNLLIKEVC